MSRRVRLSQLSLAVQKEFGFPAGEVEAEVVEPGATGGTFEFRNVNDELTTVDAVELFGKKVLIEDLRDVCEM